LISNKDTDLSREYTKNVQNKFTPDESVDKLIKVIRSLNEQDNGGFFDYQRKPIPY
jgi:thymidylate synthase